MAVRLKSVEMWGIDDTTSNAFTTVAIQWLGTNGAKSEVTATGNSMRPAHLKSKPPQQSSAGFWNRAGQNESTALFDLTGPQGTVVDIVIEFILVDGAGVKYLVTTIAVAHGYYFTHLNCLDGSGGSGSKTLVPQGLVVAALANRV